MAISETTKREIYSIRSTLQTRKAKNMADIANYQAIIAKLEAENAEIDSKCGAMKADIPEPVIEEPVGPIKE